MVIWESWHWPGWKILELSAAMSGHEKLASRRFITRWGNLESISFIRKLLEPGIWASSRFTIRWCHFESSIWQLGYQVYEPSEINNQMRQFAVISLKIKYTPKYSKVECFRAIFLILSEIKLHTITQQGKANVMVYDFSTLETLHLLSKSSNLPLLLLWVVKNTYSSTQYGFLFFQA